MTFEMLQSCKRPLTRTAYMRPWLVCFRRRKVVARLDCAICCDEDVSDEALINCPSQAHGRLATQVPNAICDKVGEGLVNS